MPPEATMKTCDFRASYRDMIVGVFPTSMNWQNYIMILSEKAALAGLECAVGAVQGRLVRR